jgi:hypothetical protein
MTQGNRGVLEHRGGGTEFAEVELFRRRYSMSISSAASAMSSFALPSSSSLSSSKTSQSAEQKFLDYANETPAQRMFDSMLGQFGVTKDQFNAMSPAEQQKITQKIQQLVQQQAQQGGSKQQPGLLTDKSV